MRTRFHAILSVMALVSSAITFVSLVGAAEPEKLSPSVDPRAEEVLGRACEALSSAKNLSYHADITFDSVQPSDAKLQYVAAMDVAFERPDLVTVDYVSDLGAKRLWYDGKTLTIVDAPHMVYSSSPPPPSVDAMLEHFAQDTSLFIPLEGFDFTNPCERIRGQILYGKYVGRNDVTGVECDHLAFMRKDADWEIWIGQKRPLPRKIVITYKGLFGSPQYEVALSNWHFDPQLPASLFEPEIPKGAERIQFVALTPETISPVVESLRRHHRSYDIPLARLPSGVPHALAHSLHGYSTTSTASR